MDTPDDLVVAAAEEVVAVHAQDAERIAVFRRRFLMALYDMGWLEVLGRDWIKIGDDGLEFAPVDFKKADIILRDLEVLGGVRSRSRFNNQAQRRLL